MNAFLAALAAIVVIAVGANVALTNLEFSSQKVFSAENVRLDVQ